MDFGSMLQKLKRDADKVSQSSQNGIGSELPVSQKRRKLDDQPTRSKHPVRTIFLVCPANKQTGGPEAQHQLCHMLNVEQPSQIQAFMLYVNENKQEGRIDHDPAAGKLQAYNRYDAPTAKWNPMESTGANDILLVWPEVWTDHMMDFINATGTQCALWWLSVNNNTGRFEDWDRRDIIHLHQSEYAKQHLLEHGINDSLAMTEFIIEDCDAIEEERPIDVVYNPNKGLHFTDSVLKRSGSAMNIQPIGAGPGGDKWISPHKVRALLRKSKVYIDFGPHPGMDRLPREAALAGCIVITNKEGAAKYDEDIPIPFKIEPFDVDVIHRMLTTCTQNFEESSKKMDGYRSWIRGQRASMKKCVEEFVKEVRTKRMQKI